MPTVTRAVCAPRSHRVPRFATYHGQRLVTAALDCVTARIQSSFMIVKRSTVCVGAQMLCAHSDFRLISGDFVDGIGSRR